jgi:hypothetical protein
VYRGGESLASFRRFLMWSKHARLINVDCLGPGEPAPSLIKLFRFAIPMKAKLAHGGILPQTPRTHVFPQLTDTFEAILLRSRYFDPPFPDRMPALRNRRLDRPNRVLVLIVHDCPELAVFFLARFSFGHVSQLVAGEAAIERLVLQNAGCKCFGRRMHRA